jgi:hypothetical protein
MEKRLNKIAILIIILAFIAVKVKATSVGTITLAIQSSTLKGTEKDVTTEGVSNLNITIGGNSTNGTFNGVQEVAFYSGGSLLINFMHNFSASDINLSKVTIKLTSTSLIADFSNQIQLKYNKTLYIDDNNFVSLCIKDAEITSITEISSGCNGENEIDFTSCLGGTVTINGINCTDEGGIIKVSNLQHSAIRGTQPSSATSGYGGATFIGAGCTYNWSCTKWSKCLAGIQTRACYNKGTCKDNKGKPVESQSCSMPSIPANITPPTNVTPPVPTPVPTPTPASTSVPAITPTAPVTPLGLGVGLIAVIAISIVITAIILKKRRRNKRLMS